MPGSKEYVGLFKKRLKSRKHGQDNINSSDFSMAPSIALPRKRPHSQMVVGIFKNSMINHN